ncbi:MAG: T9SS type A sorting domain-containing protein [Winogradskyella sp.]|nr:T9SS type A sorting domain-containing protein [Winogradskyella sp.]
MNRTLQKYKRVKIKVTIILLFATSITFSQQLAISNLNAGFQETTNGTGIVGEVFNEYSINSNIIVETILDFNNNTLSTSESDLESLIKVYPNPTSNIVTIEFQNDFKGTYTLYDVLGKQILVNTLNSIKTQASLETYDSGMYLLVLNNEYGKLIQIIKILKE